MVADYLFNDGVTRQAFAIVFASLVAFCGLVLTVGAYVQRDPGETAITVLMGSAFLVCGVAFLLYAMYRMD